MDYLEKKTKIEMLDIIENIEKHLISNNYEIAFYSFLHSLCNLNYHDKDELIFYFKNYIMNKFSNN
jgi:hypothetical protein